MIFPRFTCIRHSKISDQDLTRSTRAALCLLDYHHNIIEIMKNDLLKFNRTHRSSGYTFRNVMIILLFKLNYNK